MMKLPLSRVIDGSGATLFNPLDVAALESAYALLLARCKAAEVRGEEATCCDDLRCGVCVTYRAAKKAHEEACK